MHRLGQDPGHHGVGATNKGDGAGIVPWPHQLLSTVHPKLLEHHCATHRYVEERQAMGMDGSMPRDIQSMKRAITEEQVLVQLDHTKPYKVEIGASNYAISSVFM